MFNFDAGFLTFYKFFDLNFSGKEGTIEEENYAKGPVPVLKYYRNASMGLHRLFFLEIGPSTLQPLPRRGNRRIGQDRSLFMRHQY